MKGNKKSEVLSSLKASPLLQTSPSIQYNYANVLREKGDLDDAISYYQKALGKLPSFRRAHANLGIALFQSQKYDEAEKHLQEAVRLGSEDAIVKGLLGYCFANASRYEAALLSYRHALQVQPTSTEWQIGVARCLHSLGRLEEALRNYEGIAQAQPENLDIIFQISLIKLQQNDLEHVIPAFEYLRRVDYLDDEYEILLGTLLISDGNFLVGAQTLQETVASESFTQIKSALNAVKYCLQATQYETAQQLHELLTEKTLNKVQAHRLKRLHAEILLAKEPGGDEGLALLQELVRALPTDVESLVLWGNQLVLKGDLHKALLKFNQALNAEPTSLQALYAKALTLVKLRRYKEAIITLDEYLVIKEDPAVIDYLKAVESLQKSFVQ